jgi:stearoyl-CoA desaturase (Delta-9 desaturase)
MTSDANETGEVSASLASRTAAGSREVATQRVPDALELDIPGAAPIAAKFAGRPHDQPANRLVDRVFAIIVTFAPPLTFALAVWLHVTGRMQVSAIEVGIMLVTWSLAVAGVELGFHRLFAHKSYHCHRSVKCALAILGSLAFQGPVIWWAAVHRKHHRHSDRPGDPHSMYLMPNDTTYRSGVWWRIRGFVHAHIGWIWTPSSIRFARWSGYVNDLYRDPDLMRVHMYYFYILAAGFMVPASAGGLLHGSWQGAIAGFMWGGFIRIFFMNHLTYWGINTLSHSIGSRPFNTADRSSNSIPILFAVPTLAQSYHNNHHAFPFSSRMAYAWYELDLGHYILSALKRVGLVFKRRYPTREMIARKQTRARKTR